MKEGYERPDHDDFATSSELRQRKFSGVRHNSISDMAEIWLDGELKGACPASNKEAFETLYADIFLLRGTKV